MNKPAFPRINWTVTTLPTAIAVVYLGLIWVPANRAITDVRDQIESEREFVVQAAGLPAMLAGRQRELDVAESAVAQWEKAACLERDGSPRTSRRSTSWPREAGLTVARFEPQPVVVHEKIREIPLVIDCSGGFAQVYEFLRNIERLPATIWIESIKIENMKNSAKTVTCKATLVGFSTAGATGPLVQQGRPHSTTPRRRRCPALVATDRPVDAGRSASRTRSSAGQDARPFQSRQPVVSQR